MKKNLSPLQFSILIEKNEIDGDLNFRISGAELIKVEGNNYLYQGTHNPLNKTRIIVELIENAGEKSFLKIQKTEVNGIELNNMDIWSVFCPTKGSATGKNFGYMSLPGKYFLTLRYSPLIHNYISYFLSICNAE